MVLDLLHHHMYKPHLLHAYRVLCDSRVQVRHLFSFRAPLILVALQNRFDDEYDYAKMLQ